MKHSSKRGGIINQPSFSSRFFPFLGLLFLLLLTVNTSPSSQDQSESQKNLTWIRTGGPSGGLGYDIRIHPVDKNIMFVTDNPSGVNKSFDAGVSWIQRNEGITARTGPSMEGIPIFSLTIDPTNPDIVWTGTQGVKGIFKSIDEGETWMKKDEGIKEGNEISFRGFAVHPYSSNIVLAGAEISTGIQGFEFELTRGKIYRTDNGGDLWTCVWEGNNLARIILFDPSNPKILYASTGIFDREAFNQEGVGILKSTDGGRTWFQVNKGIPNTEGNRFVGFLEMCPSNPRILFAASGNNARGPGGIFRTLNGGELWEKKISDDIFTVVTLSPSNPDVVYAGSEHAFYRSDDFGETWQKFSKEDEGNWGPAGVRAGFPISAVVDPENPYKIYANNYGGGNFLSTDGAKTWKNCSTGYTGAHLYDIAVGQKNAAVVYTIGKSGPFMSDDGGAEWIGIASGSARYPEWYAVALNPHNSEEVIISSEHEGVLLRSEDRGKTWDIVFNHPEAHGDPQKRHGFKAIAFAPSNPNTVYAGMCKGRRTIIGDFPAAPSYGMYKSTNSGKTWQHINAGLNTSLMNINCIAVCPQNEDVVFIGTWRDGVFKTTDGGMSWVPTNNGLTSSDICSLEIDPVNPDIVYAGLGEGAGIFKSTNGGELWEAVNSGLEIQCPSYLLPFGKTTQGVSLEPPPRRTIGLDYYAVPWTEIMDIAIDPTNTEIIYAADFQTGVYVSIDGGANWESQNDGLSTRAVAAMAISSDGKTLYAATQGEGVFRLGKAKRKSKGGKNRR
jgi:photosystem II stability/assembly factor-like uncharacterized protein